MKKILFNEEDTKKIIQLYEEDLYGVHEIGNLFGVGHMVIYNLLVKNKINTSLGHRKKILYNAGKINSGNTNLTKETDIRIRRISEKIIKSKQGKIPYNKLTNLDEHKIISLYKEDKPTLDIARIFKIFPISFTQKL